MARLARIVGPGCPHHVTQRGNRREAIFFEPGDQEIYRDLLAEHWQQIVGGGLGLLPDAQPRSLDSRPGQCRGSCPRPGWTRIDAIRTFVNAGPDGAAHLFQNRYGSVVMDDAHLIAAVRYVSLNPVRARLVCARPGLALVERARPSGAGRTMSL